VILRITARCAGTCYGCYAITLGLVIKLPKIDKVHHSLSILASHKSQIAQRQVLSKSQVDTYTEGHMSENVAKVVDGATSSEDFSGCFENSCSVLAIGRYF